MRVTIFKLSIKVFSKVFLTAHASLALKPTAQCSFLVKYLLTRKLYMRSKFVIGLSMRKAIFQLPLALFNKMNKVIK